jgi:hypothetical protein
MKQLGHSSPSKAAAAASGVDDTLAVRKGIRPKHLFAIKKVKRVNNAKHTHKMSVQHIGAGGQERQIGRV